MRRCARHPGSDNRLGFRRKIFFLSRAWLSSIEWFHSTLQKRKCFRCNRNHPTVCGGFGMCTRRQELRLHPPTIFGMTKMLFRIYDSNIRVVSRVKKLQEKSNRAKTCRTQDRWESSLSAIQEIGILLTILVTNLRNCASYDTNKLTRKAFGF